MTLRTLAAALVAALVIVLAPALVRAQASLPLELTWRAPSGCQRAREVRERVRQLVGVVIANPLPLSAQVTIERRQDGRMRLTLLTAAGGLNGERRIEGRACDELVSVVAVHLALLLRAAEVPPKDEPRVSSERAAVAGRPSNQPPPTAARAAPQPVQGAVPAPAALVVEAREPASADEVRRVHGLLQLPGAVVALGAMPRPSLGAALAAGLALARWHLLVDGQVWLGQSLQKRDEPSVGAALHRASVGVQACYVWLDGVVALGPCVRLGLEHVWGRGVGANVAPRSQTATWLAGGLGLRLRYRPVAWLGVVASASAQLQSARPRVQIVDAGELGTLGIGVITFCLGTEWIL